jgi:hypothetical protein
MIEGYWQWDGLVNKANRSMVIPLGENSGYKSTNEEEFWSLSEDESVGKWFIFVCFLFKYFSTEYCKHINKHWDTFFCKLVIFKCLLLA